MRVTEVYEEQRRAISGDSNKDIWADIVINVKVYGAKGDGVTNDTAAIQAAVNYAVSIGKNEVTMPAGTYIYDTITGTEDITFVGDGVTLTGTTPLNLISLHALQADNTQRAINVKSAPYNAKGDGATDDTATLNSALANAGVVFIPEGTYMINAVTDSRDNPTTGGISLPSNTILILAPNAVLKAITNTSEKYAIIRAEGKTNVKIIGGTIQGDRSGHTGTGEWGYGICINGSTNVTIENVVIKDCWGDGIFIGSGNGTPNSDYPSRNVKIVGVTSDNNRRQGLSVIHVDGLYVGGGSKFTDTNGTAPQSGIDLEPEVSVGYYAKNILIEATMSGNTGDGIQVHPGVSDYKIVGICSNNGGRGVSIYSVTEGNIDNLIAKGNGGAGIELDSSTGVTVSGNECFTNQNGISLIGASSKNNITGNTCKANTSVGINIVGSTDNLVGNNQCLENGAQGIYAFSSTENVIEDNLVMSNMLHGINLVSSSTGNQINGNKCRLNKNSGIQVESSDDNQIHNNHCKENSQAANGVDANIHTFNSSNNSIQGNKCRQGTQTNKPGGGVFVEGGAGNIVTNNDCYLAGTISGVANTGTDTMFGAGNRNNDGTFSTTPN